MRAMLSRAALALAVLIAVVAVLGLLCALGYIAFVHWLVQG